MNCKDDCLYYEVCADFRRNICEVDQKRFIEYRMGSDGLCGWFKNKADFVEVVRCEKCKFQKLMSDGKTLACLIIPAYRKPDDFCSYGKRKEES